MIDSPKIKSELPKVGISACLLGEEVRFNGGHARNRYVTDILDPLCEWLPLCPEVGMGMSTPRETIRLEGSLEAPRLMGSRSRKDYTEDMKAYAVTAIEALQSGPLHGFILKKKSPSCGMSRLPVYQEKGGAKPQGMGMFAAAVRAAFPHLPMVEDGRLYDQGCREHFLRKLYCYKRWCDMTSGPVSRAELVQFHTAHKLLLQGHDPHLTREMGQLVGQAGKEPMEDIMSAYIDLMTQCLEHPCRRRQQAHYLGRLVAHLKLARDDQRELNETIQSFKDRRLPLAAPVTLLSHYLRKRPDIWAGIPYFLNPYPAAANGPSI